MAFRADMACEAGTAAWGTACEAGTAAWGTAFQAGTAAWGMAFQACMAAWGTADRELRESGPTRFQAFPAEASAVSWLPV